MAVRIPFDEKEALRYFGARPGDVQAAVTVDRAFLQLRNEVQPRSLLQQWSCTVVQGTENEKGRVILENGTEFVSSGLARHLEGCDRLLLFGATLGARVDIALRWQHRLLKATWISRNLSGRRSCRPSGSFVPGSLRGTGTGTWRSSRKSSGSWTVPKPSASL